nr:MAG TPA: hypothetical protein [Microviridae sp.]
MVLVSSKVLVIVLVVSIVSQEALHPSGLEAHRGA